MTHVSAPDPADDPKPGEWQPFHRLAADVASFPTDQLPTTFMQTFVAAIAESAQVPDDLPGMLLLAACSALVSRSSVRVAGDWVEPLNLFVLIAMPPGSRKSAVYSEITRPIAELEADMIADSRIKVAEFEDEVNQLEGRRATLNRKASTGDREALTELHQVRERIAGLKPVRRPRLFANDITPEALSKLLAEQDGQMAVFSPEGGLFDTLAGRYSNNVPSFDVFLQGHAAEPHRVDRKSHEPIVVLNPRLTLALTVQPDVVAGLTNEPSFRGRGLLARFLYSIPPSNIGTRRSVTAPIPQDIRETWRKMVWALHHLPADELKFTDDARDYITLALADHYETRVADGGDLYYMRDWVAKFVGAVSRIAGILALVRGETEVTHDSVVRASALGGYLLSHAKAAFDVMTQTDASQLAARIARRLDEMTEVITLREVSRAMHAKANDVRAAMNLLERHGYIRLLEPTSCNNGATTLSWEQRGTVTTGLLEKG